MRAPGYPLPGVPGRGGQSQLPDCAMSQSSSPQIVFRKVARRLIPLIIFLYILAYLDRINLGFATLQMSDDLKLSDRQFGFGAGIFYFGYLLFEVPSNLILARVGASRWIARIMISWGVIASAMMFVKGTTSFFMLRFLLGFAEA